jgi:hypothetical protein
MGEDITNWKNIYTFVALEDLSLEQRLQYAPQYAEIWKAIARRGASRGYRDDGAELKYPHLTELVSRAKLLLIGSTTRSDLGPAGTLPMKGPHRVLEVGFARNADDYFHFTLSRGGAAIASVGGAFFSIEAHTKPPPADDRDRLIDRILRAGTDGLADSAQIALAFWMSNAERLDLWEAHLATVAERAAAHTVIANQVLSALESSDPEAPTVQLPIYGSAQKVRFPACTLRSAKKADGLAASVAIGGKSKLLLPAESALFVATDEEPLPNPPREIFRTPAAQARASTRGAWRSLLVLVLIFVALGVLVMHGAKPGEPCKTNRDCRSRMCLYPEQDGYCTRTCKKDDDCPSGLVCRAVPQFYYGPRPGLFCQR